jgi:hypothetical protein
LQSDPGSNSFAVGTKGRECLDHARHRQRIGFSRYTAGTNDYDVGPQLGGKLHCRLRGEDTALQIFRHVVSTARGKGDGGNPQAYVAQELVEVTQAGLRNVSWPQFVAGVDFHAACPKPGSSHQGLPNGLPQAPRLNSDFDGWHGRKGEWGVWGGEGGTCCIMQGKSPAGRLNLRYIFAMIPLHAQSEIRSSASAGNLKSLRALFAALLIVVSPLAASARNADTIPVFNCTFGDDWDVNYDSWPDRWSRKEGPDFPHYVNIAIQDDDSADNGKCLTIDLDGAGAAVTSPPIRVMSRFRYAFSAQLKNEGLKFSSVVLTLDFCDANGRVLQSDSSEPISNTNGWQAFDIGPVEPRDPKIDRVLLSLNVVRGSKGDLQGHVSLAAVALKRLPRIDVSTTNPCNVYTELSGVAVECALAGIGERDPEIHFQLLDGANRELQSETFRLNGQLIVNHANRGTGDTTEGGEGPDGYEGKIKWQPKIPDYGFYRVAVQMRSAGSADGEKGADEQLGSQTLDLVVVPPLDMPRHGEFGWTLPDGDQPLAFPDLCQLLSRAGINWVKCPVWFDPNDSRRGDELIRFVDLLGASNIDVVGIIDHPPGPETAGLRIPRDAAIADVLSPESTAWSAALEPVMSRLALRVRWWQLGRDGDTSLIGDAQLSKRIEGLRTALFRFGQDVRMGLCSDWESVDAHTGKLAWDFMQLGRPTALSKQKVEDLISRQRQNSALRWVSVEPPSLNSVQAPSTGSDIAMCAPSALASCGGAWLFPAWAESGLDQPRKSEWTRMARASTFVHSLITAKLHGADAIFVTNPFSDTNGLLRTDGMPAELFLPWRTTASMLGGAQFLGEIQLPSGSENRVFLRPDGQVVMVAWNQQPTRETLYLGSNVRQFDIFGCGKPASEREQSIEVGPTPTFVLGLHEAIARWSMDVKFDRTQIPSIFSKPHRNALTFKNYFSQGVGGTVKVVVMQAEAQSDTATSFSLDRWTIEPPLTAFQLAAGAEMKFPFDVKLKNALYGKQPIRIDFTVEADERLEFSVYRDMEVGTDDLELDVQSHLDKDGNLVVEQRMRNRTDKLTDFKCHLRSKGRQPQRMQVYRLGKEVDRKVYRLRDGRDLIGKEMLLEIEETNGQRMLNYRFVASDQRPTVTDASADTAEKPNAVPTMDSNKVPRPLANVSP